VKKRYFILLPLLVLIVSAHAQDISLATINWNSYSAFNVQTGDVSTDRVTFINYGNDHVDVNQNNATETFTITGTVGQWTNIAVAGQIRFNIAAGEKSGAITFVRTSSTAIRVKLMIMHDETNADIIEYTIADYSLKTP